MEKKEAIKILKDFYDKSALFSIRESLDTVIPELKESEGDKVNRILHSISSKMGSHLRDIFTEEEFQCFDAWSIAWLEKQCKQEPTEKQEPKFHEGDWIVQENIGVYKVIEVCESWYEVVDNKDKHYSIGFDKEYMCRLWTIADAKDGDVLFLDLMDGKTFIYNGVNSDMAMLFSFLINNDGEEVLPYHIGKPNTGIGHIEDEGKYTYPATKEQCDTLKKAMADAGWEFDFTKKELKKIEQKPVWSEDDEDLMKWSVANLTELKDRFGNEYGKVGKCIDWIKSLKDKVQPQPKQVWSEEDEYIIEEIEAIIDAYVLEEDNPNALIDWLKSLKQRYE